jgi:hypothetical protein
MIVSKKRNKTEDIFCSTLNLTFQHMRKQKRLENCILNKKINRYGKD